MHDPRSPAASCQSEVIRLSADNTPKPGHVVEWSTAQSHRQEQTRPGLRVERDVGPTAYQTGHFGNSRQIVGEPLHLQAMQINANQSCVEISAPRDRQLDCPGPDAVA